MKDRITTNDKKTKSISEGEKNWLTQSILRVQILRSNSFVRKKRGNMKIFTTVWQTV